MQISIHDILSLVSKHSSSEQVFIFDLDSTIYDLTRRQAKIIKEFASNYKHEGDFLPIAERILQADFQRFPFFAENALKEKRIPIHPVFKKYFYPFWYERFFSNEYLYHDELEPGVVNFVKKLVQMNVQVVYLTGRDMPRMGEGTKDKLCQDGLLQHGEQLVLKPNKDMVDREFKLDVVLSMHEPGKKVYFLDNEASNNNYIYTHLPDIMNIFYDSVHSESEQPHEDLYILSSFLSHNDS
tara:strand:+ start:6406 stop:7125 length:720 start_codon:yes stop_codon:yes gene_type:complete